MIIIEIENAVISADGHANNADGADAKVCGIVSTIFETTGRMLQEGGYGSFESRSGLSIVEFKDLSSMFQMGIYALFTTQINSVAATFPKFVEVVYK